MMGASEEIALTAVAAVLERRGFEPGWSVRCLHHVPDVCFSSNKFRSARTLQTAMARCFTTAEYPLNEWGPTLDGMDNAELTELMVVLHAQCGRFAPCTVCIAQYTPPSGGSTTLSSDAGGADVESL